MVQGTKHSSAFARYNLWLLLTFLVGGGALIGAFNWEMRQEALRDAEVNARVLLDHNLSIHSYFSHSLKPHVFELSDQIKGKEYFDPTWMSSTYAVREIDGLFKTHSPRNYYYKEAAINARSPANEADEWERDFIQRLNQDPTLTIQSDIRNLNGEPYFVVLRRGESMEQECLRCHNTADEAPADLVKIYGPDRSFGRHLGEVVSAISIRVPLAEAYAHTNQTSLFISVILIGVLAMVYGLQYMLTGRMFVLPLLNLENKAKDIADDPKQLGEQLPMPEGRELNALTQAFNTMSDRLGKDAKSKDAMLEKLINSNAELEQFAYVASHDLQEPLRMVISYVQLLEKRYKGKLDKDADEYIGFAVEGASRMHGLISDLLDFSRVETRGLEPVASSSLECLNEALGHLEKAIAEKDGKVSIGDMPTVMADPAQLVSVFQNLIANSIKFSKSGTVPEVHVSAKIDPSGHDGTWWRFSIQDNGIGIDKAHRVRIFEVFQRLHTREIYPGTGIGLSVCKKIIERHGGRIWVDSTVGSGSTVYFTLPGAD